jgi:DNA-binding NarL/FixJ family response regulator
MQDDEGATLELAAARHIFRKLGAHPDIVRVNALSGDRTSGPGARLSPRELEVLQRIAAGKTNRSIAAELSLSENTVHRHVSNIFTKLGVGSRTAAAAYAFEHNMDRAVRAPLPG